MSFLRKPISKISFWRKQLRKYMFWVRNFENLFFQEEIFKKFIFLEMFWKCIFCVWKNFENAFFEGGILKIFLKCIFWERNFQNIIVKKENWRKRNLKKQIMKKQNFEFFYFSSSESSLLKFVILRARNFHFPKYKKSIFGENIRKPFLRENLIFLKI